MEYYTFNLKNFYIKKDSTLPELKYPLTQFFREKYDITDEMLSNVAVTFSMIEADSGIYRIANEPANLVILNKLEKYPDEEKYTLVYRFKLEQTSKVGRFLGEFKVDFLENGGCGKMTIPINGYINIIIYDSYTKTTVI